MKYTEKDFKDKLLMANGKYAQLFNAKEARDLANIKLPEILKAAKKKRKLGQRRAMR